MPNGVVSVGVLADFASLIEQSDAAGMSIEAFSGKVVTSSKTASRAVMDFAKEQGLSMADAADAAAKAAAAFDATYGNMSKAARDAGNAALSTARAYNASADEQTAAFAKAAAAQRDWEAQQKAAADVAADVASRTAAAAKMASTAQIASAKATSDAQADAAAKADALAARLGTVGERTTGVAKEISKLGGVGFAASIAGMGDLAAKYQQATQQIAANSDISSNAAAKIGKAFLGTSGESIYSAKEMTEAFAPVSGQLKATEGAALNSAQALKVMSAAGDLAEATSSTLTDSTAALATVMQGYHLPVSQAASASDLLFNTSRALNQPLQTVAQAINRLHGRLGDLAPSLGDVGGLMVELGSHGVQGSRGVSVVNTAFQTLVGDSQPVQQMLDALGVKVFDANGKFVGMHDVITQLQPKMAQLDQQSQDLAAKTLFGSSAAQVMLSIIQRGPAAYDQATAAAQKLGTSHRAAGEQSKTLGKQLDILKASVENDATAIGLRLLPGLTDMTKGLESGISWLGQHKAATDALAGAIGVTLGTAVTVFAYQKATAFIGATKDMIGGITSLVSSEEPAQTETEALTTAVSELTASMQRAIPEEDAAAAQMRLLGGAAADATPEVAGLDAATKGLLGSLGTLGTLSVGFGAFEALKNTPGIGNALGFGENGPKTIKGTFGTYGAPAKGETETSYIKKTLGLSAPPGWHGGGGLEHAYLQNANSPYARTEIEKFFKALAPLGHFGHHGFVPKPGMTMTSGGTITKTALNAGRSLTGFSSMEQTNAASIMALLEKGGLSTAGAAALAGNWVQESGLNPNESGGLLAQWGGSRLTNEEAFAGQHGGQGLSSEVGFALKELQGYPSLLAALKAGKMSPQQLALGVENLYERPKGTANNAGMLTPDTYWSANTAGRENYAAQIYSAFSGKQITGDLVGTTSLPKIPTSGSGSLNAAIQNIGSGGKLPISQLYEAEKSRATQLADQAAKAQAVGQAQVTVLQAINQQLSDKGAAVVQALSDESKRTSDRAAAQVTSMKDASQKATDRSAGVVQALKDSTQVSSDKSAAQVTQLKNMQAVEDQRSAIQVQAIKDQTQVIQDMSAITVATIQGAAQKIADASNAQATQITDNAQTVADTLGERGLYGLNLVAQQLQVQADKLKASFDQQIATAQQQLDSDQMAANVADAQAQLATDQVSATENMKVLLAQQNLNLVTLKQDNLVAAAQARLDAVSQKQDAKVNAAQLHLDLVTARQDAAVSRAQSHLDTLTVSQDARANAAKAHVDAITVTQDNRILRATQHADALQLSVDTTKIGPAQIAVDMNANASKTVQAVMQANLQLATAQGSVAVNQANLQLAGVTSSANNTIAGAENDYQQTMKSVNATIQGASDAYQKAQNQATAAIQTATDQYTGAQNTARDAIQTATDQYTGAQNAANLAITNATNNYQSVQDAANLAIAAAGETQAGIVAQWASTLAGDQSNLSTIEGQAAVSEAATQGAVTTAQAAASTQFAGSGTTVNIIGVPLEDASSISDAVQWVMRSQYTAPVI